MPLTERQIESLVQNLAEHSHAFTDAAFENIKDHAQALIDNPFYQAEVSIPIEQYYEELYGWADEAMAIAYLAALEAVNGLIEAPLTGTIPQQTIISDQISTPSSGQIPAVARDILEDYPDHWTMFDSFNEAVKRDFDRMRPFIIRDVNDKVRSLAIQATQSAFTTGDTFTRQTLMQDILNEYAKNGITGVEYSDGRTMKVDSYSRMVARNQVNNAARHATIVRSQQYGVNEVLASVHYPCSTLCLDEQGEVWSVSQPSEYPPLSQAIANGFFHVNCKHSITPYVEGVTNLPDQSETAIENNERRYEITQRQRYIERRIRYFKRKKAVALSDKTAQQAQDYITKWQAQMRELIDDNEFLRRSYEREQI